MICGFISSITTVLFLSRVFAGQTITGQGLEFDCLTAALLGGVSFKGGEGTIFGLMSRHHHHRCVEQCHAIGQLS